ncbi:glycosyltransferase family 2 protein [Pseudohoeflea coraliihabitans]|uniref:Glycosyltransferase family 2 protein n=1 Tax=Pseudohoeflea coraliihabitans TaxID=2860393 RepID=A0ABS6WNK3_9HYPH|nr:glycosyltransferase family 2 protein [Pseudohoeflea sp. DP4N28-3]MBW3097513.1 glycosyltransferase family 2 protein [Pseudohoeflea sp. DP4N28-3]
MLSQVTLITHTRNSAKTLPRLLGTTGWAARRIIVDMHSNDGTRDIAAAAGCEIIDAPLVDAVDEIRNEFLDMVETEWTLVLDSDEFLPAGAEQAIADLITRYGPSHDAIGLPRYNMLGDGHLHGSLWYPDHQIRLFKTGTLRWQQGHHRRPEAVGGPGRIVKLPPEGSLHIHHAAYRNLEELIGKQLHYALTDHYDTDQDTFDFNEYVSRAYLQYARRFDPHADGELSGALATIMAWDQIMRGLIHWERLGRPSELPAVFTLPIATTSEVPKTAVRRDGRKVRKLQLKRHKLRRILQKLRGRPH